MMANGSVMRLEYENEIDKRLDKKLELYPGPFSPKARVLTTTFIGQPINNLLYI